jgi:hypothetical protein
LEFRTANTTTITGAVVYARIDDYLRIIFQEVPDSSAPTFGLYYIAAGLSFN